MTLAYFDDHPEVALFGRDAAGHPIGYPMRVAAIDGSRVHFTTYRKSAKVAHFERDPRASVLAYEVQGDELVSWVAVTGTAVIWSPTEEELEAALPGMGDGTREARVPGMAEHVRNRILEGKRILLTVEVEHVRGTP
jgi:hypothetical protein